jgi:hypothetical protein
MGIDELEINEIDEAPPQLVLTPEEIEELADELVDYHAQFADLHRNQIVSKEVNHLSPARPCFKWHACSLR